MPCFVEQILIVLGLPDYSGIGHVFRDPDHVGGAVGAVCGEFAVLAEPSGNASEDEAPAVSEGRSRFFLECSADVNGMLESAVFDRNLINEAR